MRKKFTVGTVTRDHDCGRERETERHPPLLIEDQTRDFSLDIATSRESKLLPKALPTISSVILDSACQTNSEKKNELYCRDRKNGNPPSQARVPSPFNPIRSEICNRCAQSIAQRLQLARKKLKTDIEKKPRSTKSPKLKPG